MIGIHRNKPPRKLLSLHQTVLRKVRKQHAQGKKIQLGRIRIPKDVRDQLILWQNGACCYCETRIDSTGSDIDHFRPKNRALRGRGMPTHGYFWLAAFPANLLAACPRCNRKKGDHFPLDPAGGVLAVGKKPPGPERAMLIDPASEDPSEHIHFVFVPGIGHWTPTARNSSPRGEASIRQLNLGANIFIESYDQHVEEWVKPAVEDVKQKIATGNKQEAKAAWKKALRKLFYKKCPFKLLSYNVLEQEFSASELAAYGLSLPKPHSSPRTSPRRSAPSRRSQARWGCSRR